jgi:hypothetical protein
MTVWEKNGKLIESADGLVLECDECPCDGPVLCCLYSAEGFFLGIFTADDLPNTIRLRASDGLYYTAPKAGGGYSVGDVDDPDNLYISVQQFESGEGLGPIWFSIVRPVGVLAVSREDGCLISPPFTEDEFPNAVSIDFSVDGNPQSRDGERTPSSDLCTWLHGDVDTMNLSVFWDSVACKFTYRLVLNEDDWPGYGGTYTGTKIGNQNSPVGTYTDDGVITGFTVS